MVRGFGFRVLGLGAYSDIHVYAHIQEQLHNLFVSVERLRACVRVVVPVYGFGCQHV
jgi:hypothetical protein